MPSDREDSIGAAIYIVALGGIAYLIVILVQLPGASRRGDFSIYYACEVAMHRGLDPYGINLTDFTRELGLEPDPFAHPNEHADVHPGHRAAREVFAVDRLCDLVCGERILPYRLAVDAV